MKKKEQSRGPAIDTERCIRNAGGNKFEMIIATAARARELARKHRMVENYVNHGVSALVELQNREFGIEYLKKVR
jgi:DNA-directed RNA polymerase subunit K/omega